MKTSMIARIILSVMLLPLTVSAASFVVWPGQSLQAAIDAAAPGDNITVQTGSYNENITITQGVDIRGVGGAVLVTGTLTVTSPALPVYLADISFGKSGASGMTLTGDGSQKVRMDRCKLVGGGDLACTGIIAYFYKHQFDSDARFTSSTWTFQRCTVAATLSSMNSVAKCIASKVTGNFVHSGSSAGELTIFQSDLRGSTSVSLTETTEAWIAYSSLRNYLTVAGGVIEIVGNQFLASLGQYQLRVNAGCISTIRNNIFSNSENYGPAIQVGDPGVIVGFTRIFNNTMVRVRRGIFIHSSQTGVEIRGNIHRFTGVSSSYYSVSNSFAGTIVANNNFNQSVSGGVQSDNINVDPQFTTGPNGEPYWLGDTSASRNVGPEDAIFNDIDGSRNDQGAYGGHSYDPTGRTTLKPVVLSGAVSPLYVKRGGAVTIKARAAVSAAP